MDRDSRKREPNVEGVAQTCLRMFGNDITNIKSTFLSENLTKVLRSCFSLRREIRSTITWLFAMPNHVDN